MSTKATTFTVGRQRVNVSNLDKVLYPETGTTKSDVLHYYAQIAETILPHLRDRPLTLKRYPNGVEQAFFYEKNCPAHRPDFVKTINIKSEKREGGIDYCTVRDAATLLWVANLASLELHVLLAKGKNPQRPTIMMFDLDPGAPANILDCARVGLRFRDVLEHVGLKSFVKTSGSKGLHLIVPLNTPVTFEQTKPFAHAMAMMLEKEDPRRITSVMKRDLRGGKVFIDWSQNDEHKTTVCAYSLRATARPYVSAPMSWLEVTKALAAGKVEAFTFSPEQIVQRVKKKGDLLEEVLTLKQRLPAS